MLASVVIPPERTFQQTVVWNQKHTVLATTFPDALCSCPGRMPVSHRHCCPLTTPGLYPLLLCLESSLVSVIISAVMRSTYAQTTEKGAQEEGPLLYMYSTHITFAEFNPSRCSLHVRARGGLSLSLDSFSGTLFQQVCLLSSASAFATGFF